MLASLRSAKSSISVMPGRSASCMRAIPVSHTAIEWLMQAISSAT